MPLLTPGRRWQPVYYPFKREKWFNRFLNSVEMLYKGPLWGCRQCGNCLLQETAFICPMECPKGIRNGPCGGSTPEHCYVDETRPCIWYKIYERAFKMGRQELLLEVLPPLDWDKVGGEQLGGAGLPGEENRHRQSLPRPAFGRKRAAKPGTTSSAPSASPIGGRAIPNTTPATYTEPASDLERRLKAGEFVVTTEVQPPQTVSTKKLISNINLVKPFVSAVNFTDGASATPRMSSLACSSIALQQGAEPVLQIAARDTTRVALQSEVLGATALGIHNILCLSGDSNALSPSPRGPDGHPRPGFDPDAVDAAPHARRRPATWTDARSSSRPSTSWARRLRLSLRGPNTRPSASTRKSTLARSSSRPTWSTTWRSSKSG